MKTVSELLENYNYIDQLSSYLSNILDTSIDLNKELFDNTETESSFKDCKLLNSSIAHAIDYQYKVNRGRNRVFRFKNVSYNKVFEKFDLVISTDSSSFYALHKYDFIGVANYDQVELVEASVVKTKKFTISDITKNYIFITDQLVSNDVLIKVNGKEYDLVTLTLPDYGLMILNSRINESTGDYERVFKIGDEVEVKYVELMEESSDVSFSVNGFNYDEYEIISAVEPEVVQIHDYALLNYISNLEFFSNNDIKLIIKNHFYERFKSYKCQVRTIPISNCYEITIPRSSQEVKKLVIKNSAGESITPHFLLDRFNRDDIDLSASSTETPDASTEFSSYTENLNSPLTTIVKFMENEGGPNPIIYQLENSSEKYAPKLMDGNILAFFIYYKPRTKVNSDGQLVDDDLTIDEYAKFVIKYAAHVYTHQNIMCKFIKAEAVEIAPKLTINYDGDYNNIVQAVSNALDRLSDTIGGSITKSSLISKLSAIEGVNSVSDNSSSTYPSIGSTQYPKFNKEGIIYESNKSST